MLCNVYSISVHESILVGKFLKGYKMCLPHLLHLCKIQSGEAYMYCYQTFNFPMDHLSSGKWISCNFLGLMDINIF